MDKASSRARRRPRWHYLLVVAIPLSLALFFLLWVSQWERQDCSRDSDPALHQRTVRFTPSGPSDKLRIRVVSDRNGLPVPDARIEFATSLSRDRVSTDLHGSATLQHNGELGRLTISAKGYIGLAGRARSVPGDYCLSLTPTGAMELRISDHQDQPVSGVEIELCLPPRLPSHQNRGLASIGELQESLSLLWEPIVDRQQSGPDGIVRWGELPPGEGFVWKVVSSHLLEDRDAFRTRDVKATSRGFIVGGSQIATPSRQFEVKPAEIIRLTARILRPTSVVGVLPLGPGATGRVNLFHRSNYMHPMGKGALVSFDHEATALAGAQGNFRLGPVNPGAKCIRAAWSEPGGRLFFSFREFELLDGEHRDLGVLAPSGGVTVHGSVRLEREELLPQAIRSKLSAHLHIRNRPPPPFDGGVGIVEKTEIALGPFILHGIIEGNLAVRAELSLGSIPGVEVENMPERQYPIPGTERIDLVIRIKALAKVQVNVNYPDGNPPHPLRVFFAPQSDGNQARAGYMPSGSAVQPGQITGSFSVAAGVYEVWVFSDCQKAGAGNYFGKEVGSLTASEQNQVRVEMGPGATIRGRYVLSPIADSEDPRVRSPLLGFKVEPYLDPRDHVPYMTRVDTNGNFTLTGVAPNSILVPTVGAGRIRTHGPGSEVNVDVVRKD